VGGGNFTHGAGGHIWGPSTHEPIDEETAYAVRFAPDRLVLAVNSERRVQFLDVLNEAAVSYPLPVSRPESVVFLPGSANSVVVAGKYLFVLNTAHSNRRRRIKTGFRAVKGVAASSDGQFLVAVGTPGEVEVINVANGQCAVRYDVEFGGVNAVSVAPDGLTFAVGTEKGLVLFDVDSW
jgi:WD40 repeat protein